MSGCEASKGLYPRKTIKTPYYTLFGHQKSSWLGGIISRTNTRLAQSIHCNFTILAIAKNTTDTRVKCSQSARRRQAKNMSNPRTVTLALDYSSSPISHNHSRIPPNRWPIGPTIKKWEIFWFWKENVFLVRAEPISILAFWLFFATRARNGDMESFITSDLINLGTWFWCLRPYFRVPGIEWTYF